MIASIVKNTGPHSLSLPLDVQTTLYILLSSHLSPSYFCPSWMVRCRQRCRQRSLAGALPSDSSPLPSALPSTLIGWRVAIRCVTVTVSVSVSVHWLARCRQLRHRCRQRCRQPSLAGALPSDASPLPSALIGWRVDVSVAVSVLSAAETQHTYVLNFRKPCRMAY